MSEMIPKIIFFMAIAAPVIVFTYRNRFNNFKKSFLRAIIAILLGWLLIYCYLIVVQSALEPQEINGAANAFVSVLGWAFPTALVVVGWLLKKFLLGLSSKYEI